MTYEITRELEPLLRTVTAKYPFRQMKIGDGFTVETAKERASAVSSACNYGKTNHGHGKKFRSEARSNGYRIWRVA